MRAPFSMFVLRTDRLISIQRLKKVVVDRMSNGILLLVVAMNAILYFSPFEAGHSRASH